MAMMTMPSAASAQIIVTPAQPKTDEQGWLSLADYPESPIRRDDEGTVRVLLHIDANGRVSACDIVRSSGSRQLDSTTCLLVKRRARFIPATDEVGNPIPDAYLFSYTWRIPSD